MFLIPEDVFVVTVTSRNQSIRGSEKHGEGKGGRVEAPVSPSPLGADALSTREIHQVPSLPIRVTLALQG